MKKLLISLSFLIVFFTNNSVANIPGNIHEYTVDLYYANGVLASEEKIAEFDWLKISTKLKIKYPSLRQALKYGEAKLAYNASYLWGVGDFFESLLQYAEEHAEAKITWELIKWWSKTKNIADMVDKLATFTSLNTLAEQEEAYMQSVKQGHGVITVAHSQGNFFTNQAFDEITKLHSWMKPYLSLVPPVLWWNAYLS